MMSPGLDAALPALAIGLLVAVAVAAAALLRGARCPGAAVVGGIAAGLLLGPTVFGRVLPETHEALLIGGVEAREQRDAIDRDYVGRTIFMEQQGDPAALEALHLEHEAARAPAVAAWERACREHQRPRRVAVSIAAALMLLLAGTGGVRAGGTPSSLAAPLSVGGWAAVLPGGVTFIVLRHLLDFDVAAAAAVAAGTAIGPFVLTAVDREAADRAEVGGALLVRDAGRVMCVVPLGVLVWSAWQHRADPGALNWCLPLAGLPLGWLLRLDARGGIAAARDRLLVPTVAAAVAVGVDLYDDFAIWPLLLLIVASADGRWVGATAGAMVLGQRQWLRTMRLVMGVMAAGPNQLALAIVATHAGVIEGPLALALAAGAVTVEVSPPLRRAMTRRLSELEQELEAGEGE